MCITFNKKIQRRFPDIFWLPLFSLFGGTLRCHLHVKYFKYCLWKHTSDYLLHIVSLENHQTDLYLGKIFCVFIPFYISESWLSTIVKINGQWDFYINFDERCWCLKGCRRDLRAQVAKDVGFPDSFMPFNAFQARALTCSIWHLAHAVEEMHDPSYVTSSTSSSTVQSHMTKDLKVLFYLLNAPCWTSKII